MAADAEDEADDRPTKSDRDSLEDELSQLARRTIDKTFVSKGKTKALELRVLFRIVKNLHRDDWTTDKSKTEAIRSTIKDAIEQLPKLSSMRMIDISWHKAATLLYITSQDKFDLELQLEDTDGDYNKRVQHLKNITGYDKSDDYFNHEVTPRIRRQIASRLCAMEKDRIGSADDIAPVLSMGSASDHADAFIRRPEIEDELIEKLSVRPTSVWVHGDAGVGKTKLIETILEEQECPFLRIDMRSHETLHNDVVVAMYRLGLSTKEWAHRVSHERLVELLHDPKYSTNTFVLDNFEKSIWPDLVPTGAPSVTLIIISRFPPKPDWKFASLSIKDLNQEKALELASSILPGHEPDELKAVCERFSNRALLVKLACKMIKKLRVPINSYLKAIEDRADYIHRLERMSEGLNIVAHYRYVCERIAEYHDAERLLKLVCQLPPGVLLWEARLFWAEMYPDMCQLRIPPQPVWVDVDTAEGNELVAPKGQIYVKIEDYTGGYLNLSIGLAEDFRLALDLLMELGLVQEVNERHQRRIVMHPLTREIVCSELSKTWRDVSEEMISGVARSARRSGLIARYYIEVPCAFPDTLLWTMINCATELFISFAGDMLRRNSMGPPVDDFLVVMVIYVAQTMDDIDFRQGWNPARFDLFARLFGLAIRHHSGSHSQWRMALYRTAAWLDELAIGVERLDLGEKKLMAWGVEELELSLREKILAPWSVEEFSVCEKIPAAWSDAPEIGVLLMMMSRLVGEYLYRYWITSLQGGELMLCIDDTKTSRHHHIVLQFAKPDGASRPRSFAVIQHGESALAEIIVADSCEKLQAYRQDFRKESRVFSPFSGVRLEHDVQEAINSVAARVESIRVEALAALRLGEYDKFQECHDRLDDLTHSDIVPPEVLEMFPIDSPPVKPLHVHSRIRERFFAFPYGFEDVIFDTLTNRQACTYALPYYYLRIREVF